MHYQAYNLFFCVLREVMEAILVKRKARLDDLDSGDKIDGIINRSIERDDSMYSIV